MPGTFDTIVETPAGDWTVVGFVDGIFDDDIFDALVFDVESTFDTVDEPSGSWTLVPPP